ncbi:hypothetical protein [Halofilum ochraceum]|uniref:hypothetical protein n=1 Tax=Halofilum ochraceum TaxID=1611323 RepID=UPI001585D661|nr:hypothetical protein [Halofilum ochraceum]
MPRARINTPVTRMVAGAFIMLAAIGLQFAMVIGLLEAHLPLSLAGYIALFIGMAIAVTGVLDRRA